VVLIPDDLRRDRLFRLGLALKLLAIVVLVPAIQQKWFTAFLVDTLSAPSLDPWTRFIAQGGDPLAFPYGPVMYLFHAPTVAIGMVLDRLLGLQPTLAQVGFGLSLLLADLALLVTLHRIAGGEPRRLVLFYWWSPIAIFIIYWHGQTDVVPTLLVTLSLLMLQRQKLVHSGALLGLGIAAKLSCAMVVPFVLLFLWVNRRYRAMVLPFAVAAVLVAIVVQGPYLLLPGTQAMVLGSPEIAKVYDLSFDLADGTRIFATPLFYLLLVYAAWRIGRMNFELLYGFLGVSFLAILLLTPASVGWYLWALPFLAIYQLRATRGGAAMALLFGLCFVLVKAPMVSGAAVPLLGWDFSKPLQVAWPGLISAHQISLGLTALTALGIVLAVAMLNRSLVHNDFYRLSRRPLLIGIAGDSGTGKDTLSAALVGLFGRNAVAAVSGDDYHLFERQGPLYQSLTHLDPRANDLRSLTQDVLSLLSGKAILWRHYDHATGLFTPRRQIAANDVVLISGLHALYPAALRQRMDVAVFLDMDENLRRYLKLRRDVGERGHAPDRAVASIERRREDFAKYVAPQIGHADISLSLQPAMSDFAERADAGRTIPLRLRVRMRDGIRHEELARGLIALCGLRVDVDFAGDDGTVELTIEGEVAAEDLAFVASTLVPHLEELLPIEPAWQDGITGVMQLCVLVQIADSMQRRS
jgi:uridine kinase